MGPNMKSEKMNRDSESSERRRLLQEHWTEQLYKEYKSLCFQFGLSLQQPLLQVVDLPGRWGLWDPVVRSITISFSLIQNYSWDIVIEILKHEVAHQVVSELYGMDEAHGSFFRLACQRMALPSWAARSEVDLGHPITPWTACPLNSQEEKLLKKAEKLFALATSSNEFEAHLAMRKAQELYAKHQLSRILQKRKIGLVSLVMPIKRKRIERYESMIGSILVQYFSVKLVYIPLYDARDFCEYQAIEIMGTPENVLLAEYIYQFLWNKIHQLWEEYRQKGRMEGRSRRSYLLGILSGFSEKLREGQSEIKARSANLSVQEDKSRRQLVTQQDRRLKNFMNQRYPRLVDKSWRQSLWDRDAYDAGIQEGHKLTITQVISKQAGNRGRRLTS